MMLARKNGMNGRGPQEGEAAAGNTVAEAVVDDSSNNSETEVLFDAHTTKSFSDKGKAITFDQIDSEYKGIDADGVFTIPDNGKYEINFLGQSAEQNTAAILRLNSEKMLAHSSYVFSARQDYGKGGMIKLLATANLNKGDKIEVILEEGELQTNSNLWVKFPLTTDSANAVSVRSQARRG